MQENIFKKIGNKVSDFFVKLSGREDDIPEDEIIGYDGDDIDGYEDNGGYVEDDIREEIYTPRMNTIQKAPSAYRMQIVKPRDERSAEEILNLLKKKYAVVINVEYLDKQTAQYIMHYISGGVYALDGTVQKVNNAIFLAAPFGIEIATYDRSQKTSYDMAKKPWEKVD